MKELSLFTGAGGGLLGTKLLGFEHVGYVEIEDYCQRVISQRIKDGILDDAPIFSDIRTFISEGYADSYKGMVDVITAGFPCQPFSVAGKGKNKDDHRNMWPDTIGVIRRVRPDYALLENVPGLLSRGHRYFEEILKDLAESGYSARWKIISASELGAPHKRDRLFVLAYANSLKLWDESRRSSGSCRESAAQLELNGEKQLMAKSFSERLERYAGHGENRDKPGRVNQEQAGSISEDGLSQNARRIWSAEPDVGRVANGVASRVHRLKAIGNGQVPIVVKTAWELLTNT